MLPIAIACAVHRVHTVLCPLRPCCMLWQPSSPNSRLCCTGMWPRTRVKEFSCYNTRAGEAPVTGRRVDLTVTRRSQECSCAATRSGKLCFPLAGLASCARSLSRHLQASPDTLLRQERRGTPAPQAWCKRLSVIGADTCGVFNPHEGLEA